MPTKTPTGSGRSALYEAGCRAGVISQRWKRPVYQLSLNLTSSTLMPEIARCEHERDVSVRSAQLGGKTTLNRRERLPAARYLFDAAVSDPPAWLDIVRAPARWRQANRLVADIAREIAEGAGHELYSKAHTELELSFIGLFVAYRQRPTRCHSRLDQQE